MVVKGCAKNAAVQSTDAVAKSKPWAEPPVRKGEGRHDRGSTNGYAINVSARTPTKLPQIVPQHSSLNFAQLILAQKCLTASTIAASKEICAQFPALCTVLRSASLLALLLRQKNFVRSSRHYALRLY